MSVLRRREVVKALLANRGDLLVVAGLGSTAWDCTAAGDHPLTFPLWGGMGCAAVTGLGLALAQPARRVLVVTGDGEMLMGLGSLATIGVQRPANLSIVVIDNERYGETGMQKTHTAHGVDLAAMARAAGFASAVLVREASAIEGLRQAIHQGAGPYFAQVKVAAEKEEIVLPPREGTLLKNRFREALLGASASLQ
ncbi:MAG TPA: thiamine pyrophosphate-dependent enzyme [Burkholderiales bacterium]|nr:thiamine pyrophosphate-dependent enzyme [Burkholderiales bacterium]